MRTGRTSSSTTARILIVGGGFAGVNAAAGAIATIGSAQDRVAVQLISPDPFWVMKPRLYERDLTGVRVPLAEVLDPLGVTRHQAMVRAIDTDQRQVVLDDGSTLTYDQLVLAAGSRLALPDGPGVHCVDTYEQAMELRSAVDALRSGGRRLRAVVVGGGFTGIELAAELAHDAEVTLLAAPTPAPGYGPRARKLIEESLSSLGVTVRAGVRVSEVADGAVLLSDNDWISAELVAWAAGPRASELTAQIPAARDSLGRLLVDGYLRAGTPGVWAAGDSACAKVDATHSSVMSCQQAGPQGRRAGENAAAVALGHRPRAYRQALYLTCLALGERGGLLTCGFERDTVLASGQEAAQMKRAINHGLIYPPAGQDRQAMLKIGKQAPPGRPLAAAIARGALRSRRVRAKVAGAAPGRSAAYATAERDAAEALS